MKYLALGVVLCALLAGCAGGARMTPATGSIVADRHHSDESPPPSPGPCGWFSISANFDRYAMKAGDTLWFAGAVSPDFPVHSPTWIAVSQSTLTFTANGAPYTITLPNGIVTFDTVAKSRTLSYSAASGWTQDIPWYDEETAFVTAIGIPLPSGLPGNISNVTWSGFAASNQPGQKIDFSFSAGAYAPFGTDNNALGLDALGTPENYSRDRVRGALEGKEAAEVHYPACANAPTPVPSATPITLPSGSPPPSAPPPGVVNQYPAGTQVTSGIASGPDGALWFTGSSDVDRTTTAGAITQYVTPTLNAGVTSIARGPDGALWFTEYTADKIGRITTTGGAITEYPIPTAGAGPQSIINGPDGALWFTESGASAIGRIATDGTITQYPTLTPNAGPYGLAAGADGTIWFTENTAGKIGRISIAGVQNEYTIPTAGSAPMGIAVGPDSAMWFTESAKNAIGRVTLAGAVTEYTSPSIGGPVGISVGADQAMWFTQAAANALGRITTAGAITQYALPNANAQPSGIVYGPDGALWFTEPGVNQIGRIVP